MTPNFRRSLLAGSVAALAVAGLLGGCQKATTTSSDGTTTTTTTTIAPAPAAASAADAMKSAAKEVGAEASAAMTKVEAGTSKAVAKAGEVIEDSVITAKVKTALLADPDVKGLRIDVDTKDGVVTLKGTADKAVNVDRAVRIARDTSGVKSVENQLVVKS